MLPQQWLVSSVGQSAALRTPVSGVRISHESQKWRLGRLGVCAGLLCCAQHTVLRIHHTSAKAPCLVAPDGFEPPLADSESVVLAVTP